ncbi:MAG: hypothetical protein WCK77_22910 [Verrucomicrobiota bacterium]
MRNFSGYFAKYIGKDAGATGCLPGRWCGNFNKRLLLEFVDVACSQAELMTEGRDQHNCAASYMRRGGAGD